MAPLSFRSQKNNTRLTDFEDIKEIVLRNSVKNVPDGLRQRQDKSDIVLAQFI